MIQENDYLCTSKERLFSEASLKCTAKIDNKIETSHLYRGYKITKNKDDNEIEIYDIYKSPFYNTVRGELLQNFIDDGFIKTCDKQQTIRDERRIKILDYYIMRSIIDANEDKTKELQSNRLDLLVKINNLKERVYAN